MHDLLIYGIIIASQIRRRERQLSASNSGRARSEAPAEERIAAFAHFCAHDLPDFRGWCERIRARVQDFYPADVRLVDDQAELLANVAGAQVIVVESLAVGAKEIAAAGGTLKIVQKYGVTTPRIDSVACESGGRSGVDTQTARQYFDRRARTHVDARAGPPA